MTERRKGIKDFEICVVGKIYVYKMIFIKEFHARKKDYFNKLLLKPL